MSLRRSAIVLGLALLVVLAPGIAFAQDVTPDEGVEELATARELVERSVSLYEAGDTDAAYKTARNSYLDHFEYVEIPLRVRDEGLTLEVEEDYAELRGAIDAGASLNEVEAIAAEVLRGLDDVERTLSEPGLAAPVIALGYSFSILFREGLEAVLIVAAILGYLEASRNTQYKGAVLKGVGAAGVATIALFALTTLVIQLAPVQREIIEAVTAAMAVGVLFYVSFWLISRLEHKRWMEFVKAKVWTAATTGSTLALAAVGFTAVFREGFETVLFYQALLSFARGLHLAVLGGVLLALAALGAIGWLIFKAGRRIPIKVFLTTAVTLVMVLSVTFVGNAVRGFQQAAIIPINLIDSLPRLPIFLGQLTGFYPTRETLLAQGTLIAIYIAGALWTFVVMPRRQARGRAASPETTPTVEPERVASGSEV